MTLEERYQKLCQTPSSVNEHLPKLREYAEQCDSVCELGVDIGQSTTAFLMAQPRYLLSIDISWHPELSELDSEIADLMECGITGFWVVKNGTRWEFRLEDSRTCTIPPVDLLFIDSDHCYSVIKTELERHHSQVRRWLIIHDTFSFGEVGADGGKGIVPAIGEFLVSHPEFREREHFKHNNGLLILERHNGD